jgi:outer membrane protein OmpA-like peptidoglycan-associated protein
MNQTDKNKQEKDLLKALSPLVNQLIDKNYEESQDKIASQMAPLIGSAIKEQIKNQKDDVVDALYPVMGNMISRYVSKMFEEMLNSINKQIQTGLSFETLSRKLRAKIQGVSETQLLLSETSSTNIRAAFLIHKDTGIVLAQAQSDINPINEADMLASMMTAIRSFVNDWVEQNEAHSELGEIEYGGSKIILEASSNSYLAVIVDGASYIKTNEKIRYTLDNIITQHSQDIKEFDGDLSSFPTDKIETLLTLLLEKDEEIQEDKKLSPIIFLLPLIFFLWLGWYLYNNYLDDKLSAQINSRLYTTELLTIYRLNAVSKDGNVILKGEVPFPYHKKLARSSIETIDGVKNIQNEIVVVKNSYDPMQVSSNIAYLLAGLNLDKGINISYDFDFDTLLLKGSVWDTKRKEKILQAVKKIKGIEKIHEEIGVKTPIIETILYFQKSKTELTISHQTKLIELITLLKELDSTIEIDITAYSDLLGNIKTNKKLMSIRAKNTARYLQNQGKLLQNIALKIISLPPEDINTMNNPDYARCVVITYKKKSR